MASALPLKLSINPDPAFINWFGRNADPVSFVLKNIDTRTIKQCKVNAVRADLMPAGSIAGESAELSLAAGEGAIADEWIQARLVGGEWKSINGWTEGLSLGELEENDEVTFEVALTVPDVMPIQGKISFSLMIAATEIEGEPEPEPAIPMFLDDFESYTVNTYPSANFTIIYNGSGTANQKVIEAAFNGATTKCFQLEGRASYASDTRKNLNSFLPLPDNFILDAWIKPITGSWAGSIGLYNTGSSARISEVDFVGSLIKAVIGGNIAVRQDLQAFSPGNWYRVTMVHRLSLRKYDVYINEIIRATDLNMHLTQNPRDLLLLSGNTETNRIYFDKVGLYDGSVNTLESIWRS